ncbi:MAG: zinc ribbon domain-containing protein [Nitrosotalea sp.]
MLIFNKGSMGNTSHQIVPINPNLPKIRSMVQRRTSQLCPICGDRIQEDRLHRRKLWCTNCKRVMDRDVVAALNISYKGWSKFCHPRGLSDETMSGNVENLQPLILGVDGSKLQIQR